MSEKVVFLTIEDAETYYINSGIVDWEWFKGFNENELIKFLYIKSNGVHTYSTLIKKFLKSKNEKISHYGF